MEEDVEYPEAETTIAPGKRVEIYTDGVRLTGEVKSVIQDQVGTNFTIKQDNGFSVTLTVFA